MHLAWSTYRAYTRGCLQGGRRREKCVLDRVIDGASTECQSVHSAYKGRLVRTKPKCKTIIYSPKITAA